MITSGTTIIGNLHMKMKHCLPFNMVLSILGDIPLFPIGSPHNVVAHSHVCKNIQPINH